LFLESSKSTDFKFNIIGRQLTTSQIEEINNISSRSKVKKRVKKLQCLACMFDFVEVESQIFSNNLKLIDSALPEILACMVLRFYLGSKPNTFDLIVEIEQDNLLNFDMSNNHPFYKYKVKRLLNNVELGMLPNKLWKGDCRLYEEVNLGDHLLRNTMLEEALNSRHDFGNIYSENGSLFMNLNLQIRFVK
jgi:type II restriction enzyme